MPNKKKEVCKFCELIKKRKKERVFFETDILVCVQDTDPEINMPVVMKKDHSKFSDEEAFAVKQICQIWKPDYKLSFSTKDNKSGHGNCYLIKN